MNGPHPWRPTRRRLTDTFLAAVAPVAVCGLALAGLTAWADAGKAGSPPRITVSNSRVYVPNGADTAAFFDVANLGGADDRLIGVTSSATTGEITLGRRRTGGQRADVASVVVAAGRELSMSPDRLDVALRAKAGWRGGRPRAVHAALRAQRGGQNDRGGGRTARAVTGYSRSRIAFMVKVKGCAAGRPRPLSGRSRAGIPSSSRTFSWSGSHAVDRV
ncbi:copper chaperone PCu(A)C [Streptomyces sp. MBT65]|uniref:copper chaperone PCu(A)C n=1 Tax=Streptomyces sp. MBT65 TaxID=1488395 RepID=UPI0027D9E5E5|nr:copper chaperone PCu(A)C [Streptomyces sp. MBT65]